MVIYNAYPHFFEKAIKPLLAAALAVSLCPLVPAKEAQL